MHIHKLKKKIVVSFGYSTVRKKVKNGLNRGKIYTWNSRATSGDGD